MHTLCVEGNIPEFEGYDAQHANTKGGLGAYFGDKLEGLADIRIPVYGFQPAYAIWARKNGPTVSVDYQKLIEAGIISRVVDDNGNEIEIKVNAWDDRNGLLENERDYSVKFFRMNRGGSINYLLYCPEVFDLLYTDYRGHRFTQEIVFGKAVYKFMKQIGLIPDILHLNEAHTVVAASHMRNDEVFDKTAIVYTNHTIVPAGMETFRARQAGDNVIPVDIGRLLYFASPHIMFNRFFIRSDGVVDFCYAATQLADIINGVSNEHAFATVKLFREIYAKYYQGQEFNAKVVGVLNGSGDSWIHPKLREIENSGRLATQEEIAFIHGLGKQEAFEEVRRRTVSWQNKEGIRLDPAKPTFWEVRRGEEYKSQLPILRFLVHLICAETTESYTRDSLREAWFRDITGMRDSYNGNHHQLNDTVEKILELLFKGRDVIHGLGGQVVVGGPSGYKEDWANEFSKWAYDVPSLRGKFVFIPNSDSILLKMQAIGADVCINNPLPLLEACGTSDQRTGRNGGLNIALAGAGPVEWITGELTPYLFGPYTKGEGIETIAQNEQFYNEAPAQIYKIIEKIVNNFRQNRSEHERTMFAFYRASQDATARAMEKRYGLRAYPQAIAHRQEQITARRAAEVERSKGPLAENIPSAASSSQPGSFGVWKWIGITNKTSFGSFIIATVESIAVAILYGKLMWWYLGTHDTGPAFRSSCDLGCRIDRLTCCYIPRVLFPSPLTGRP